MGTPENAGYFFLGRHLSLNHSNLLKLRESFFIAGAPVWAQSWSFPEAPWLSGLVFLNPPHLVWGRGKHTGKVCRGCSGLTVFLCTRVFSFSSLLISCIALYLDVLEDVLREAAMCFIICKCSQHHSLELGVNFIYCFQLCFLFLEKKKKKEKSHFASY